MNRGFVILAQNSGPINYIKCAEVLCNRIKYLMPTESVTLITDIPINSDSFDNVIIFPYGDKCVNDEWKLANDWQVYDASPYDYTIKLEADIYLPRTIEHWWEILSSRDLVISTTIRNFKNEISTSKFYRKILVDNKLPDTYNAITYFKKSNRANEFFKIVRNIFDNWENYKKLIKCYDTEQATTDIVYALAVHVMGIENCTLPSFTDMSMIHMKKIINDGIMTDWTKEYVYEITTDAFRINTIPQLYPIHYHIKDFANTIQDELSS